MHYRCKHPVSPFSLKAANENFPLNNLPFFVRHFREGITPLCVAGILTEVSPAPFWQIALA